MSEEQKDKKITAGELLKELKLLLKDNYVAKINTKADELILNFLNGQSFTFTVWENTVK